MDGTSIWNNGIDLNGLVLSENRISRLADVFTKLYDLFFWEKSTAFIEMSVGIRFKRKLCKE